MTVTTSVVGKLTRKLLRIICWSSRRRKFSNRSIQNFNG